jgi:hypothetical protein
MDPRTVSLPLWYCSPGRERPPHIPYLGGVAIHPQSGACGPDGLAGTVYGGAWDPATYPLDTWAPAGDGIWIHAACSSPQACLRLDLPPTIGTWRDIPGAAAHHRWSIPVLLQPREDSGGIIGMRSALSRTWRKGDLFTDPGPHASLQRRLLDLLAAFAGPRPPSIDDHADQVEAVVLDLLRLGHILTDDDLSGAGWLTEEVALHAIHAACDLTPDGVDSILAAAP